MGRPIQIIFSVVSFIVVVAVAIYFTMRAKKTAEQASKAAAQRFKRGVKTLPKEAQPLAMALQKQGLYVECHNSLETSRLSSVRRYASWVKNIKEGPTGKERNVYGIYKISGLKSCEKNIKEAGEIDAKFEVLKELEKTLEAYISEMGTFVALVDKMHQYYKDEDYKDDKFAKGRAFHKQFLTLMDKVHPLGTKFKALLHKMEDGLTEKRLAYYKKKYGEEVRYLMLKTRAVSKEFFRLVLRADTDIAKVEKGLKELQEVHAKLSEHFQKNKDDIREKVFHKDSFAFSTLESLVSKTREYITHGKKYVRGLRDAVQDKKKLDKFMAKTRGTWGSGTKVIDTYNTRLASIRLSIPW